MPTINFDTLEYAHQLKLGGFTPEQAEAEARALAKVFEVNAKDLATKQDIAHLERSTESGIANLERSTESSIANLEHSTERKFELLRQEMATKEDLSRLKEDFGRLELRVGETKSDLIKWMAGFTIANMTLVIAVAAFFSTR